MDEEWLGDRKIISISAEFGEYCYWKHEVGVEGVTSIEVEDANGQMAGVPWFSVYVGGAIRRRVNAAFTHNIDYEIP